MRRTLSQWLCLLWDIAPPLHLNSDTPYIEAGAIHLPARSHWQHHAAAAAHAAAHLVYSPRTFDGSGLGAIARALTALLEDARVEALAIRELPGLARLWRPLHTATPDVGCGFEALMARLARALADPDYDDAEPWVQKGRMLLCHSAHPGLSVLQTPDEVRRAATQLGHDIGQMRLPFNAATYCPAPLYRDDHRWMWPADVLHVASLPASAATGGSPDDHEPALDNTGMIVSQLPEWDYLISRMRPDWCRVIEQQAPRTVMEPADMDGAIRRIAIRLRTPLRALTRYAAVPQLNDEGEIFDPAALVDWRIARRLRNACETRVYRGLDRRVARAALWLLIDQSASTSAAHGPDGQSVLRAATLSAAAIATMLQIMRVSCAITGFSSRGRHAVRVAMVKTFDEPAGDMVLARLHGLRPGDSTRLGAALRHATRRLAQHRQGPRCVVVISDAEPHDVDVHDPRYLIEDARRAVGAAARIGVRVVCLVPASDRGTQALQIFDHASVQAVRDFGDLPRALSRLMAW